MTNIKEPFMRDVLLQIQDYADWAHGEQMRKFVPERYITHPIRVMEICRSVTQDQTLLAAALLHDVLEDTPVEADELLAFLRHVLPEEAAKRTLQLVIDLTDTYTHHQFPEWNRKKRKAHEIERLKAISGDAQTVKYADIIDNSKELAYLDTDFAEVFLRECRALLKKMTMGNPQLYDRAVQTVAAGIAHLERGK
ncbi:HD domain-containing protein [Paraflavitalea pollutisoli]|uniref:HD domain-containing protein n=1 Tax=Paraflavitalea pollutisoli TaxID=3034143 RepID=UPI0023ED7972|nr:HD domain-containing protein [Paraflavitalea sp. H1-2-19X]